MNKRQYKKYLKKYKVKSYYDMRSKLITKNLYARFNEISDVNKYNSHLIYIIDSKRGDLKHIQKITLFSGTYPVSINSDNIINSDTNNSNTNVSLEYFCSKSQDHMNQHMKLLDDWRRWVCGKDT